MKNMLLATTVLSSYGKRSYLRVGLGKKVWEDRKRKRKRKKKRVRKERDAYTTHNTQHTTHNIQLTGRSTILPLPGD
jgi:hypothetical protein